MQLDDFDYPLDESLIAQEPIEPRDHARLLIVDRRTGSLTHSRFDALPEFLRPGDLLVVNNTQVIPARLYGRKRPSGGKIELLLIRPHSSTDPGRLWFPLTPTLSPQAGRGISWDSQGQGEIWEALIRGRVRHGQELELPQGMIVAVLASEAGRHLIAFPPGIDVTAYIEKAGVMPLPPYIRRPSTDDDRARYQTVYARHPGAVAAPTAGLHFTPSLLERLQGAGVGTVTVTLHVGLGTFKPVSCGDIRRHTMDPEWYEFPEETAQAVQATRERGGRIIAVGSTSARVLETVAANGLPLAAHSGETSLFIYPGYVFNALDGLITNFHLPKTTLFMLVCALADRARMLEAYRIAAAERYRFYSYGDAMLIL